MKFKEAKTGTHLNFLHKHAFLEHQSSPQQPMTISYNSWNSSMHCTNGKLHVSERAHNLHKVPSDSDLQLGLLRGRQTSLYLLKSWEATGEPTKITDVFPVTMLVICIMRMGSGIIKVVVTVPLVLAYLYEYTALFIAHISPESCKSKFLHVFSGVLCYSCKHF